MRLITRVIFLGVIATATILLTACPNHTTVSQINADPGRFRNKEVSVSGRVTDSFGVMGKGTYELDDGTGRIWVATQRGVPARGSRVEARGRVINGFTFGGRSFGTVLQESDRKVERR